MGRWAKAIVAAVVLEMSGCSVMHLFGGGTPTAKLEGLTVIAADNANSNMATALDVVFVYSAGAAAILPQSAPEWFAHRDRFIAAAPTDLDVVSLQIPPAFVMRQVTLPARHDKALQVVAYANYIAAGGQNKLVLTGVKKGLLRLEAKSMALTEE